MENKYLLKLYVAGISPDIQTKIVSLKSHLNKVLGGSNYNLNIIDILEMPELAEEEHILATPTVVRLAPVPVKKVILNLNNSFAKDLITILQKE